MCWNADISLNTFLFACLALVFIWVANTFTKYKSNLFSNKLLYLLLFAVAAMQLVEYFLWKNLKNFKINTQLSMAAISLVVVQQLILMFMIPNEALRTYMLLAYAVFVVLFYVFKRPTLQLHTSIGKNGHLSWDWLNYNGYEQIWLFVGLLFYLVPVFMIQQFVLMFFLILFLSASLFYNYKFNTFGSMWCWASNFFLLYLLVDILLVKPYREYNGLC
jgi:hypothetical protein